MKQNSCLMFSCKTGSTLVVRLNWEYVNGTQLNYCPEQNFGEKQWCCNNIALNAFGISAPNLITNIRMNLCVNSSYIEVHTSWKVGREKNAHTKTSRIMLCPHIYTNPMWIKRKPFHSQWAMEKSWMTFCQVYITFLDIVCHLYTWWLLHFTISF